MASTKIQRFAIYSPVMGKREDFPNLLLNKAFTPDQREVQIWNGEIRKSKLRKPELHRTTYAVVSVNTTSETITISGNHVSEFPSGTTITIYNVSDSQYENFTLSTTSVSVSSQTVLTVTGDLTASTPNEYVYNNDGVSSNDPSATLFRSVATPDSNPIMRYALLTLSSGTERTVAFTKAHAYYWDTSLTKWQTIFTCASNCEYWDSDQYGDYLVATNNIEKPIYWDGSSVTTFTAMDTQLSATTSDYIDKAKFIKAFRNYIILGNVELSSGDRYQHYIYWCNVGEGVAASGWRQDASKDAGYANIDGAGHISGGFGLWEGYLCVFKRLSIRKLWYTGDSLVFNQDVLLPGIGSSAPGSVLNTPDGRLYFYGSDKNFREISLGKVSQPIDVTCKNINPSLLGLMSSLYIDEYDEIWWSVAYGNSATANNKILKYKDGKWRESDIEVVAFGQYYRQTTYTWDTLPYDTWDTWSWDRWDSAEASSDFPVDLCSDADGNTYELHGAYSDIGDSYDSYFTLSFDLADKKALPYYKRILQAFVYLRKESSGTLTLSAKRDNESDWQSLGSVNLSGDEDIHRQRLPIDIRGRHFLLKGLSTSKFSFIGIEFEFILAGER